MLVKSEFLAIRSVPDKKQGRTFFSSDSTNSPFSASNGQLLVINEQVLTVDGRYGIFSMT